MLIIFVLLKFWFTDAREGCRQVRKITIFKLLLEDFITLTTSHLLTLYKCSRSMCP